MVRFRTFKSALGKIESINIQKVPETEKLIAKRACFDKNTKQYKFYDKKGNEIVKFHQYDVRIISRISTDDDKFEFLVSLKDDIDYRMEFNMQDGYSFFVTDKYENENTEAVIKAVPKYLCEFKGKHVRVLKTTEHSAFSIWNADTDSEDSIVTESFVINNFDYEVERMSGLAVVNLSDKDNTTYAKVLGVTFIVGDINANGVIIGANNGEYVLKIVD